MLWAGISDEPVGAGGATTGAVTTAGGASPMDSQQISWFSVEPPVLAAKPTLQVVAAVSAAGAGTWITWVHPGRP